MEIEVGALTGAAHGEKSPLRLAKRNGYRERDWETRAGTVELRMPKLSKGSYCPGFLVPRRMAGKAPIAVVQEAEACPRAWPEGAGDIDPLGRRSGQGDRDERHLQKAEPCPGGGRGVQALGGDRRQGEYHLSSPR